MLETTARQSGCALVKAGLEIIARDHNFSGHKIDPLVIHFMNQSLDPVKLLYSSVSNGTGRTYVSLHNAILHPSNNWIHAAHFQKVLF